MGTSTFCARSSAAKYISPCRFDAFVGYLTYFMIELGLYGSSRTSQFDIGWPMRGCGRVLRIRSYGLSLICVWRVVTQSGWGMWTKHSVARPRSFLVYSCYPVAGLMYYSMAEAVLHLLSRSVSSYSEAKNHEHACRKQGRCFHSHWQQCVWHDWECCRRPLTATSIASTGCSSFSWDAMWTNARLDARAITSL